MPNWTQNILTVTGGAHNGIEGTWKDFGARTQKVIEHGGTMLEHYIPKDPRVGKRVELSKGYTFSAFATVEVDGFDGYQWCLDNWGCKWPENDCELDIRERSVRLSFVTPWDAPVAGLLTISKLFRLANFRLVSDYEGCDDIIRRKFHNGALLSTEWVKGGHFE